MDKICEHMKDIISWLSCKIKKSNAVKLKIKTEHIKRFIQY